MSALNLTGGKEGEGLTRTAKSKTTATREESKSKNWQNSFYQMEKKNPKKPRRDPKVHRGYDREKESPKPKNTKNHNNEAHDGNVTNNTRGVP